MLHRVGGVKINVLDEGAGPPILFLHGLGGCWRDWYPQLDSLSESHRCIVVEHRGHGRSELTDEPYSTALFARDALAVCHQLGVDRAHVVGLSMGGMVAQALAVEEPEFVDTLVLCDTGAYMPEPMGEALRAIADATRVHGFPDSHGVPTATSLAWSKATLSERPHVARDNTRETECTDPEAWARAAYAVTQHDTRGQLASITAPVLLVWGEEDELIQVGPASRPLLEGLPNVRLEVVRDAAHLVNLEQPEAFDRLVTEFFAAHGARAGAAAQA